MSWIDWSVMLGTLLFIALYGVWKTRGSKNIQSYILADNSSKWWTIGLSVMATQASAITFLSTPGQAYAEGMGFVQFYFGLPLAMIIISVVFIPIYYKLKVYTAYEFLESRFDLKTRMLTAALFLVQRSLAAGITIYAPAIILSQILGWSLNFTILFIGGVVILYTVSGGTKAVNETHRQQMTIMFLGVFIGLGAAIWYLSEYISFNDAIRVAGRMGKMNIIDTELDFGNRYTLWSGLIGGLFLQLSYFGTDHSQVARYLGGQSVSESRLGLMFNGLLKIPMQFLILLTGVLVFVFYQFHQPPVHFNKVLLENARQSAVSDSLSRIEKPYGEIWNQKNTVVKQLVESLNHESPHEVLRHQECLDFLKEEEGKLRLAAKSLISVNQKKSVSKDADYVFISFIMSFLPIGLVGFLLAVIFSAGMSSTSAELNALASTATVDYYRRSFKKQASDSHYVIASKWMTTLFGALAVLFALIASFFENLIQAVNILGSLFYGTILGVFMTAFFLKRVKGHAVFIAALLSEAIIICIYLLDKNEKVDLEFMWLNPIGCLLVMGLGLLFQTFLKFDDKT